MLSLILGFLFIALGVLIAVGHYFRVLIAAADNLDPASVPVPTAPASVLAVLNRGAVK